MNSKVSRRESVSFLRPILAAESLSGRHEYGKYVGDSSELTPQGAVKEVQLARRGAEL